MAVTQREQQIIDLHEAGCKIAAIASKLGLKESYVRNRIGYLCTGLGIDGTHRRRMASGSARLAEAVQTAGGHR